MRKILLLVGALALVVTSAIGQSRTITGKVTDEDSGEGLPGVNVVFKGSSTGTITDFDGNYSLEVPSDGTLVFSFVGMLSQEIPIGNQSVINVAMSQNATELAEVVVTGYAVEQKRDLTGSIASIKSDAIQDLPTQSFDRAMQGRAAGVQISSSSGQPGGALNVVVRGMGSLSDNTPLYIVDGVQVNTGGISGGGSTNALAGINPNDIESIEILKDAAASAIYGAQSANGVVIITTKKGKANTSRLDVSIQRGVVRPLNLYDVMDAQQFAEIREEAYINAGKNPADAWAQYGKPGDASTFTNYDWVNAMFRDNAQIKSYQGTLSGGNDLTTFYISASYEHQDGQTIMSDWNRANMRFNIQHKVNDKLSIGTQMNVARQHTFGAIADGNWVNGPFQSAFVSQPNSPAIDPETGEYNPYPAHLPVTNAGHNFNYNILQGVNEERREGVTAQALASFNMSYKIIDNLSFNVFSGIDFQDNQYINERPATIPVFSGFGGQTFVQDRRYLNWNGNSTLNYAKKFGSHNVNMIVGTEYKESVTEINSATGRGFANTNLRLLDNAAKPQAIAGSWTGYKRFGYFAKGTYDFNSKYYVNATIRRDGNSRFGVNNQYGTFYAIGGGWRISDEAFFENVTVFDDLKLRVSYGELGNANGIGNFQARAQYGGGGQYLGGAGSIPTVLQNDLLGWEREKQINLGIDFAILSSRISGAIDFWRSNTQDQLLAIPLPSDSGFGGITGNAGNVLNEGIELEIAGTIINGSELRWDSRFNISFQRNELTALPNGEDRIGNDLIVGEPVGFIWGVEYAGVNPANGKAMWYDTLGMPVYTAQERDAKILGSTIPTKFGGWSNVVSYKGLSMEIFFQYSMGHKVFLGDGYNLAASGSFRDNQLVSQLDRWQQPGDVTNVPMPIDGGYIDGYDQQYPGFTTSRYLMDGSYIRLKQITLSYDLPEKILNTVKIKNAKVFVQGMNLYTFTKFEGIDPEVVEANNNNDVSTFGAYPNGKQFTIGVNLGL
ncbi:MAG: TonB-dependent receptor [Cyclobacteriaceae bacterium]|nr:TonB-dependent receptor [Cyclobacteriaceae bacterium]